jgi:hypothetical protein
MHQLKVLVLKGAAVKEGAKGMPAIKKMTKKTTRKVKKRKVMMAMPAKKAAGSQDT